MSLSEKINLAKKEIDFIRMESNKKAMVKEDSKRMAEVEKREKEEKEVREKNLANKNWEDLKPLLINSLKEINKGILSNKGYINNWETVKGIHFHATKYTTQDDVEISGAYPHFINAEFLKMNIPGVGNIFIDRIFKSAKGTDFKNDYDKVDSFINDDKIDPKRVYFSTSEWPNLYTGCPDFDKGSLNSRYTGPCHLFDMESISLSFNPSELENNISKAEDIILKKIIALHK